MMADNDDNSNSPVLFVNASTTRGPQSRNRCQGSTLLGRKGNHDVMNTWAGNVNDTDIVLTIIYLEHQGPLL